MWLSKATEGKFGLIERTILCVTTGTQYNDMSPVNSKKAHGNL